MLLVFQTFFYSLGDCCLVFVYWSSEVLVVVHGCGVHCLHWIVWQTVVLLLQCRATPVVIIHYGIRLLTLLLPDMSLSRPHWRIVHTAYQLHFLTRVSLPDAQSTIIHWLTRAARNSVTSTVHLILHLLGHSLTLVFIEELIKYHLIVIVEDVPTGLIILRRLLLSSGGVRLVGSSTRRLITGSVWHSRSWKGQVGIFLGRIISLWLLHAAGRKVSLTSSHRCWHLLLGPLLTLLNATHWWQLFRFSAIGAGLRFRVCNHRSIPSCHA